MFSRPTEADCWAGFDKRSVGFFSSKLVRMDPERGIVSGSFALSWVRLCVVAARGCMGWAAYQILWSPKAPRSPILAAVEIELCLSGLGANQDRGSRR